MNSGYVKCRAETVALKCCKSCIRSKIRWTFYYSLGNKHYIQHTQGNNEQLQEHVLT